MTSQLEILKSEWGLKILGVHVIGTRKDLRVLEDAYREKVYNWSRKKVAKQQSREYARMQMETVS